MWVKDLYGQLLNLKNVDAISTANLKSGRIRVEAIRWISSTNGDYVSYAITEVATEKEAEQFMKELLARLNRM